MGYKKNDLGKITNEGKLFPELPFQMVILDQDYSSRYCLPCKVVMTVTHIRYSIRHKEIRYDILDALFDFPWKTESCQILDLYHTN